MTNDPKVDVLRYAAFAAQPGGGNPAGIVLDASTLDSAEMLAIAAEVGYAETAFIVDRDDSRRVGIRYFSPHAEVPFCGHATIATAVVLAEREGVGAFRFDSAVGPIVITTNRVQKAGADTILASFTSVAPQIRDLDPGVLAHLLELIGLTEADLDRELAPRVAYAGNWHPVLVVADRARFDGFAFDPQAVRALMDREGWTGTVTIVHRLSARAFEARNLFPVGDITEDPATGSAAAAFGGYLRELGAVTAPSSIEMHQGAHVGRPSLLSVDIPVAGGITVSGSASPIATG